MRKRKLKLIDIPWSRMLKFEIPEFAERITELVERYNPEELKIKEMHDLLIAEQANIAKLVVRHGPHPLTEELRVQRGVRSLHVNAIGVQLKLAIKKDTAGTNKAVKLVKIEINRFFGDLNSSKNSQTKGRKITQFIAEVNTNVALQTALESLKFTDYINNLTAVHSSIQELTAERSLSKSKRPTENTPDLMDSVLTATRDLLKEIELAAKKNPDLDYAPLCNELNVVLIEYRDMINKRVLFNKRTAEKNNENAETTEDTATTEASVTSVETEPAAKMTNQNAEEVDVNMNSFKIELAKKEEAAAMGSKSMQLPRVNEDDEA